ncbi:7873_t:CDS:2, partial [Racocetra fulgida]
MEATASTSCQTSETALTPSMYAIIKIVPHTEEKLYLAQLKISYNFINKKIKITDTTIQIIDANELANDNEILLDGLFDKFDQFITKLREDLDTNSSIPKELLPSEAIQL